MKIAIKTVSLILLMVLVSIFSAFAEIIILENEEVIQGRITNYSKDKLSIETEDGVQEIPYSEIHLIDYIGAAKDYQKLLAAPSAFIIYLKNGEIIEGRITQYSDEFITLESITGAGVLQLPTSSVSYITSKSTNIDLNQRSGIGYLQKKSTINTSDGLMTYNSERLSYKFFYGSDLFGNFLLAYGNANYNGVELKVMALDYRMGMIFQKLQNTMLYGGGSLGYLQITDDQYGISGTGTSITLFLGAELFFPSLPSLGFAAEIGYGTQKAGDYSASDLSISNFPSFSIHYYY